MWEMVLLVNKSNIVLHGFHGIYPSLPSRLPSEDFIPMIHHSHPIPAQLTSILTLNPQSAPIPNLSLQKLSMRWKFQQSTLMTMQQHTTDKKLGNRW